MARFDRASRGLDGNGACDRETAGSGSGPLTRTTLLKDEADASIEADIPAREVVLTTGAAGSALRTFRHRVSALFHVDVPREAALNGGGLRRIEWRLPGAILHRVQGGAMTLRRSRALIKRSPIDDVAFYLLDDGEARCSCDGRDVRVSSGDIVVLDYARPFDAILADFTCSSLTYDRKVLPASLQNLHGVRLAADQASTKLLATHIRALLLAAPNLRSTIANAAAAAFLTAAAATFDAVRSDEVPTHARLRDNALAAIRRRLADPDLSPNLIAADINVSRSRLYRLFAKSGGVGNLVVRLRLEGAFCDLIQHPRTIRSIGEVAARHGFKSSAHFSRVFKRGYGRTPSDVLSAGPDGAGTLRHSHDLIDDVGDGTREAGVSHRRRLTRKDKNEGREG